MKKQNVNKLVFAKTNVAELNDYQMYNINGGTSPAVTSSMPCAAAVEAAAVSSTGCIAAVAIGIKTIFD
ncbi:class I lanthipeptide [Flavobacterium amniphilum]|uniref:class I lanthipeptide n=1 Tax=Flavobacterium amniphilum TaxID=1834035 RepID=UPI00202A5C86|nr:class I lanthipeptide [Flavobacterium amniphilum]MCL9807397.1 class I lanthipeptide [Flavobacterium amniphilum]